jgi:hypothetical protein
MLAVKDQISNSDDIIDSREVIQRIEELEEERQELADNAEEAEEAEDGEMARQAVIGWDKANGAELSALQALAKEAEGYAADWEYGETLIRDSYFTEYAKELCKDIGAIPRDLPSYIEIDWEATADNLRADYTSVDFDGVTYWIR